MSCVDLSKEEILNLIKKVKGNDWQVISYQIKAVSDDPIGFFGNHYYLNIETFQAENNNESEVLQFFIKTAPILDAQAQYIEEIGAFKKEVVLQKHLLPLLLKSTSFLKHQWAANCHIIKDNLLLFDDLSLKDYKMAPGREILDFDHCVAALKTLADFHGASIIWEENNKRTNGKLFSISDLFPEAATEVCYIHERGHTRNKWLHSVTNATKHLCKLIGRKDEAQRIPRIIENAVSTVGPSNKWRNVLSHADLWSNNFMFKYNSDGTIQHCVLVDYQLARYAPVALDLMCCIHLTAPLKLRSNHMGYFVNTYYERLSHVLSIAGLDVKDLIPRSELIEGCGKYKIIGIVEAIFYGTTIWIPSDLSSELFKDAVGDRTNMVEKAFYQDDFFKNQMTDLVTELLDYTTEILQ